MSNNNTRSYDLDGLTIFVVGRRWLETAQDLDGDGRPMPCSGLLLLQMMIIHAYLEHMSAPLAIIYSFLYLFSYKS